MKTRDRLENMLIDKGLTVDLLWGAEGQWRKTIMDVMRWEANCHRVSDGAFVHVGSWNTMTECVRRGFELVQDERSTWEMEAMVNTKKPLTPIQAANALADLLRPRGWLVSVGVGGETLYVYTTTAAGKQAAERELAGKYAGYPVLVRRMGQPKARSLLPSSPARR